MNLFALTVLLAGAEPAPRKYRVEDVTRTARLLRQSGATLHLDLPLVSGRERDVPADLAAVRVRRPEALRSASASSSRRSRPALADCSTISLGYEADAYFADKPEELKAYRRLFDGAVEFLDKTRPAHLGRRDDGRPDESVAPGGRRGSSIRRARSSSTSTRRSNARSRSGTAPPAALEADWKRLLESAKDRPIAFPEVSYSSAAENGSTPEKQAEFIRRLRRFLSTADGARAPLRPLRVLARASARPLPRRSSADETSRRRASYLSHRGLQGADGDPSRPGRNGVARIEKEIGDCVIGRFVDLGNQALPS